jgi:hypothetical protein
MSLEQNWVDDKGGNMSGEFDAFCIYHAWHLETAHRSGGHPQQDGVAAKANRTMEEGVVSMLYESDAHSILGRKHWPL